MIFNSSINIIALWTLEIRPCKIFKSDVHLLLHCASLCYWWARMFFFIFYYIYIFFFFSKSTSRLMTNQSWHWDCYQNYEDCSLDIETFRMAVLILRPVLRRSGLQSWYRDWYQDFQDCSLDIETVIETRRIVVLISRLV